MDTYVVFAVEPDGSHKMMTRYANFGDAHASMSKCIETIAGVTFGIMRERGQYIVVLASAQTRSPLIIDL